MINCVMFIQSLIFTGGVIIVDICINKYPIYWLTTIQYNVL